MGKITIVKKSNGYYTLKNVNNKFITDNRYFRSNEQGSLDLNVIDNYDGTISLFVVKITNILPLMEDILWVSVKL